MAETKRPCADCDNVEPCDLLERCIKHDPAPKVFDSYTRLSTPDGTHIENCPVCAADPEVWQYIDKPGEVAQKVVCCAVPVAWQSATRAAATRIAGVLLNASRHRSRAPLACWRRTRRREESDGEA